MKSKLIVIQLTFLLMSIILTSVSVFAVSETKILSTDTYQKIEHGYVLSNDQNVETACDDRDLPIARSCTGDNKLETPTEHFHTAFLIETENPFGVSCRAKSMAPEQIIRIDSTIICKRSSINS